MSHHWRYGYFPLGELPQGLHFPPAEVEAARIRVLKRRIKRRIIALLLQRRRIP